MTRFGGLTYRLVLRAFPASFRRRHAADMIEHFTQQRAAVRGQFLPSAVLWARACGDALRHGLALRFAGLTGRPRQEFWLSRLRRRLWQSAPRRTEFRQALRSLRRSPLYALTVVAVIAISTALSATVFAIVDGVLFKPLPYPKAENLYLASARRAGRGGTVFKMDEIAAWRAAMPDLPIAAMQLRRAAGTLGDGRMYGAVSVDERFFDVLGHRPLIGGFAAEHFHPGGTPVAIISYRLWQRLFAGREDAIGRELPLVGAADHLGRPAPPATVVGILPRDFVYPAFSNEIPDVLRPLALTAAARSGRNESALFGLIRRPDGLPIEQLQHRLDSATRAVPPAGEGERAVDGVHMRALSEMALTFARSFRTLTLVAASLLALACLGVAGLSAARARQRERDVVLRRALGATTWDLFRQSATEVAVPVFAGSALGFAIAPLLLEFTLSLLPVQTAFVKPPQIDPRVAWLTVALALTSTLVIAFSVMRTSRRSRLPASGSTNATARFRGFGQIIVAGQTGLGFALTLGGTLVLTSLWHVWQIDPGYDSTRIAVIQVSARSPNQGMVAEDALEMNDDLARLPGVAAAGVFAAPLLQHGSLVATVRPHAGAEPIEMQQIPHGGDLIGVLQLTPIRGRLPTPEELTRHDPVALVSERAARSLWPEENPIGRPLLVSQRTVIVIGVVRDLQFTSLDAPARGTGQVHLPDLVFRRMAFLLRTTGPPGTVVAAAKAQIAARRDQFEVLSAGTMEEALAGSIAQRRFSAWAYGGFAVCALAITSVGILGLVAMISSLRTREMAVRLALGAAPGRLVRLLLKEQLLAVASGLAAGALVSAWSVGALSREVYGVTTGDPLIWTATAATILATASLGTLVPALRLAGTDPIEALRVE